jgi:hypothetical protein
LFPWIPNRLKAGDLDGRKAVALVNAMLKEGIAVVLRRRVEETSTVWTIHAWFEDFEIRGRRKTIDLLLAFEIAAATALILAVDAERLLRRSLEDTRLPGARIRIDESSVEDLEHLVADDLKRHVRVEPEGWSGQRASITIGKKPGRVRRRT